MADRRIPRTSSEMEVRRAFQQFDSNVTTLEDGTVSVDVIAVTGSLLVKDSDTTAKSYSEFSQGTDNQVMVSAGAGVNPVWTTDLDGLTLVVCDNITIDGAAITSDTGAISFGNENLTTTGTLASGAATVDWGTGAGIGLIVQGGGSVFENIALRLYDKGAASTNINIVEFAFSDGSGPTATSRLKAINSGVNSVFGGHLILETASDAIETWNTDQLWLQKDGTVSVSGALSAPLLTVDNITIDAAQITSDTGAISFSDENLSTTGNIVINSDSSSLQLGAAQDALVYYDGSDLIIDAWAIGDGSVTIHQKDGLTLINDEDQGLGVGSSVEFHGRYRDTPAFTSRFGKIEGLKETAADQNSRGVLTFYSSNASEAMRIGSENNIIFWGTSPTQHQSSYFFVNKAFALSASSGVARSFWLEGSFTATQDNDDLAAIYLEPTFVDDGKTGVNHYAIQATAGDISTTDDVIAGTLIIGSGLIVDSSGAISFDDENLVTTGTLGAGATTVTSLTDGTASLTGGSLTSVKLGTLVANGFVKTSGGDGTLSVDTSTYLTAEADTLDTVADRGATTDQTLIAGGFTTTGVVTVGAASDMVISVGSITSVSGAISFGNENLSTTGTLGAGATTVTSLTDGVASLTGGSLTAVKLGTLVANGFVKTSAGDGTLSVDTSIYLTSEADTLDTVADRGATTDQALTAGGFATGTLTLAGGSITDSSGAIGFGNENLTTTGTLASGTITVSADLVLATGSITSASGAISFGNENLATTGTLGIGTASPARKLEITATVGASLGDIGSAVRLSLLGQETVYYGEWTQTHLGSGNGFRYDFNIEDFAGMNGTAVTIYRDGNVGIDNTAPTNKLDVTGDIVSTTLVTANTLTIAAGSVTDTSGAISFGNENLTTTGTLSCGALDATGTTIATTLVLATGSITDSSGAIDFGNENLSTTGTLVAGFTTIDWGSGAGPGVIIQGGGSVFTNVALSLYDKGTGSGNDNVLEFAFNDGAVAAGCARIHSTSSGANAVNGADIALETASDNVGTFNTDQLRLLTNGNITASSDFTATGVAVGTNIPSPSAADEVLISDSADNASWTDPIWSRLLASNETIFIRQASGDDSNDGESSGTALLTIQEGINRLYRRIANGYTITMDIGEGVYTLGAAISPAYPYGYNVEWRGSSESHVSCAISNIGSVTASGLSGLDYIDFDITLPATKVAAVGDFISVTAATGGANPHLTMGTHEVTAIAGTPSGNVATVRMYRRNGPTDVPTTSAVVSCTVIKTVLYFSGSNGLKLNGAFHSGTWGNTGYGICFKGNHDDNGIWALNGASVVLGNDAATSGWSTNLYAQNGALIFADYTCHSKSDSYLVRCQNGAVVNLRYGCVLTGAKTGAILAHIGGTIAAYEMQIYLSGSVYGIACTQGGFVDFTSGTVKHGHASSYALSASTGGRIDATVATISDYTLEINNSEERGAVYDGDEGTVYGEIYAFDAALTHTISGTGIGNKVQVTAFNANGHSHRLTPDHTSDDITIDIAGDYLCTVSINLESVAGGAQTTGVAVYKNNGATLFSNLHMHRKLSGGGGDLGAVSLNGIIELSVSDTIEVWIWNSTTGNIIVDDVTLTLTRLGR